MKCAACGYERIEKTFEYQKVVFFQSGPRKGEIKETYPDSVDISVGDDDFLEYDITQVTDSTYLKTAYSCPKCGTLKIRTCYE